MNSILATIVVILLGVISLQDFKYRGITWYLMVCLLITAFSLALLDNTSYITLATSSAINLVFITSQIFAAALYFWIKKREITKVPDVLIGRGDLFFLGIMCIMFSTLNLIAIYSLGLIISLTVALLIKVWQPKSKKIEVPFAGCLAIILIPFFLFKIFKPDFNFYNDYFINQLLFAWK